LFAIFQFFTGFMVPENYLEERRMTSFYSYPAAVGLFLAPVLAMFIGIIIEKLKTQNSKLPASSDQAKPDKTMAQNLKLKINQQSKAMDALTYWEKIFLGFSLVTIALSTLALLATKTEGAYLGVLAAVFIILMFTPWYKWILAGSLIISLTILAIPPSRQYVIQKATFSDTSGDVRKVLWQGTFRALKENPIFGGGLSGFPDLYKQYKEKKHVELLKYPHNIIFNFWTETGILGLISFFWLVFVFFKNIFKKYPLNANRYTLTAIAAAMLALLIYGLLDVPYFKNDLSTLFWVLIGLALV
jgi:O-antigen ligase